MANFRIYNDTLCPDLWDSAQHLDPEVRVNLLRMAYDFYEKTKLPAPIIDVYLMGSIANYNWTADSDADVHVIIDYNKLQMPKETGNKTVKNAGAQWNQEHEIFVKGHKVEMNIQNSAEEKPYVTGIYSLVKDQWIRKPVKVMLQLDRNVIQTQYKSMKAYLENAMRSGDREQMKAAKKYMDAYRQYGLDTYGELSYENVVFKILRARGIIKQLKDGITAVYDQEMTVDEAGENDIPQTLPDFAPGDVPDNPELEDPRFDRSLWDKQDKKTGQFRLNRLVSNELKSLRNKAYRMSVAYEKAGRKEWAEQQRQEYIKYDTALQKVLKYIRPINETEWKKKIERDDKRFAPRTSQPFFNRKSYSPIQGRPMFIKAEKIVNHVSDEDIESTLKLAKESGEDYETQLKRAALLLSWWAFVGAAGKDKEKFPFTSWTDLMDILRRTIFNIDSRHGIERATERKRLWGEIFNLCELKIIDYIEKRPESFPVPSSPPIPVMEMPQISKKGKKLMAGDEPLKGQTVEKVIGNIVVIRQGTGGGFLPEGWTLVYFMDSEESAQAMQQGQIPYLIVPIGTFKSGGSPITDIWKKKFCGKPGQEHILGVIQGHSDATSIFIDMITVRPGFQRNHIAKLMMDRLKKTFPKANITTSSRTDKGDKFAKGYGISECSVGAGIPEEDRLKIHNQDGSVRRWQIRSKDAPKTPQMTDTPPKAIKKFDKPLPPKK